MLSRVSASYACLCDVMEQDYWDVDDILAENQVRSSMLIAAATVYI